jgi:hypothetical protein
VALAVFVFTTDTLGQYLSNPSPILFAAVSPEASKAVSDVHPAKQ